MVQSSDTKLERTSETVHAFYNTVILCDTVCVDLRPQEQFDADHVLGAVSIHDSLECESALRYAEQRRSVLLYGGGSSAVEEQLDSLHHMCSSLTTARFLQDTFEAFRQHFPFLCSSHPSAADPSLCYPSLVLLSPPLYLSSELCASTRQVIEDTGIRAVVNCSREIPNHFSAAPTRPGEGNGTCSDGVVSSGFEGGQRMAAGSYATAGPTCLYHRVPIDDALHEDLLSQLPSATEFIHAARSAQHAVLVHCAQGRSRSVSVVIAYLMRYVGMSCDKALEAVVRARSVAGPNPAFMQQLRLYESMCNSTEAGM